MQSIFYCWSFKIEEEREKQKERRKREREKLQNKRRNLESLVKDAEKKTQAFEKKVKSNRSKYWLTYFVIVCCVAIYSKCFSFSNKGNYLNFCRGGINYNVATLY